jgi:hypothetical protein
MATVVVTLSNDGNLLSEIRRAPQELGTRPAVSEDSARLPTWTSLTVKSNLIDGSGGAG